MTPQEFFEKAERFEGTAYVAFELDDKVLAIGRRVEGGPVCLYERDHAAEPEGYRHVLAEFEGNAEASRAGAFIANMGEALERAQDRVFDLEDEVRVLS